MNEGQTDIKAITYCKELRQILNLPEVTQVTVTSQPKKPRPIQELSKLNEVREKHEKTGLQKSKLARNTEMGRTVAIRMFDEKGEMNLDLLKQLENDLDNSDDRELPQTKHASSIVKQLQKDKKLRGLIMGIEAPKMGSSGALLVQSVLGLPPDVVVTKEHAQQAATSALLTQLRQSDAMSCFATSIIVGVQEKDPRQFILDMKSLLEEGSISRTLSDKTVIKEPVNLHVCQLDLEKQVTVGDAPELTEQPGFVAGLDALGIAPNQRTEKLTAAIETLKQSKVQSVKTALRTLPDQVDGQPNWPKIHLLATMPQDPSAFEPDVEKKLTEMLNSADPKLDPKDVILAMNQFQSNPVFTPQDILETLAKNEGKDSTLPISAFLAQQENLLLRAFEYTVASLSTQQPGGNADLLKKYIQGDVTSWIETSFQSINAIGNENALDELKNNVESELSNAIDNCRILFDPRKNISGGDGSSSRGGWVLEFAGKMIETPSDCKQMVEKVLNGVEEKYNKEPEKTFLQTIIQETSSKIIEEGKVGNFYITGSSYPTEILQSFSGSTEPINVAGPGVALTKESIADIDPKFQKILSTAVDTNFKTSKLLQTWLESQLPLKEFKDEEERTDVIKTIVEKAVETGSPSAGGLLEWFVTQSQSIQNLIPDEAVEKSSSVVWNNKHAFSLKVACPFLREAGKKGKSGKEAVLEFEQSQNKQNDSRLNTSFPINNPLSGEVFRFVKNAVSCFPIDVQQELIDNFAKTLQGESITVKDLKDKLQKWPGEAAALMISQPSTQNQNFALPNDLRLIDPIVDPAFKVFPNEMVDLKINEFFEILQNRFKSISRDELQIQVRDYIHGQSKSLVEYLVNNCILEVAPEVFADEIEDVLQTTLRKLPLSKEQIESVQKKVLSELEGDKFSMSLMQVTIEKALESEQITIEDCSEKVLSALRRPAGVVIADSNWGDGEHTIVYSMLVNPATGEIEMWQMNEDGTDPRTINDWVKQGWAMPVEPQSVGRLFPKTEKTIGVEALLELLIPKAKLDSLETDLITLGMNLTANHEGKLLAKFLDLLSALETFNNRVCQNHEWTEASARKHCELLDADLTAVKSMSELANQQFSSGTKQEEIKKPAEERLRSDVKAIETASERLQELFAVASL